MFTPLRIVTSSLISRNNAERNVEENEINKTQKINENDDFLKNLDHQTQSKIMSDINNKLKMNNQLLNKKRNFDSKFNIMKKRFETETRIFQQTSLSNLNKSKEKYKVKMSSADKYFTSIHTVKGELNNNGNLRTYSSRNRNFVSGQVVTKIEKMPTCKNTSNSNENDEKLCDTSCTVDKESNTVLYQFPHSMAAAKRVKCKRKTFMEEFNEYKDKYGINMETKKKLKNENYSNCFTLNKELESDKYNDKIITPFKCFKTSFFADVNHAETAAVVSASAAGLRKNRDRKNNDFTSDWVKGGVIKREKDVINDFNETMHRQRHQVPESKHVVLDYSDLHKSDDNNSSESKTPTSREDDSSSTPTSSSRFGTVSFDEKNIITTVSNSVQYSREIVIRKTKISRKNFPSHLFH